MSAHAHSGTGQNQIQHVYVGTRGEGGEARARELTRRLHWSTGQLPSSPHPPPPHPRRYARALGCIMLTIAQHGACHLRQHLSCPPALLFAAAAGATLPDAGRCPSCELLPLLRPLRYRQTTGRGAAAHCQRSGARQSLQASRSTRSPTCGAAGSCSRSARALLRDKKEGRECGSCFATPGGALAGYQGPGSMFDVAAPHICPYAGT